jgi:hypothetical protein
LEPIGNIRNPRTQRVGEQFEVEGLHRQ